jgi:hypothetical protein
VRASSTRKAVLRSFSRRQGLGSARPFLFRRDSGRGSGACGAALRSRELENYSRKTVRASKKDSLAQFNSEDRGHPINSSSSSPPSQPQAAWPAATKGGSIVPFGPTCHPSACHPATLPIPSFILSLERTVCTVPYLVLILRPCTLAVSLAVFLTGRIAIESYKSRSHNGAERRGRYLQSVSPSAWGTPGIRAGNEIPIAAVYRHVFFSSPMATARECHSTAASAGEDHPTADLWMCLGRVHDYSRTMILYGMDGGPYCTYRTEYGGDCTYCTLTAQHCQYRTVQYRRTRHSTSPGGCNGVGGPVCICSALAPALSSSGKCRVM